jgi:hypothetical protein
MTNSTSLIATCLAMVVLVILVGVRLLYCRVSELRAKRIHPQATAQSAQMAALTEDSRAADNFRNLFEVPVLFYALVAMAIGVGHTPDWLVVGAWAFVVLRYLHSFIQCTYNRVFHRLPAFMAGFAVLVALWVVFFLTLPTP